MKKIQFFLLISLLLFSATPSYALNIIRDLQTENFLNKVFKPVFKAANLENQIDIYIIRDGGINAFVAGGKNIFINTGTILQSSDPLGLIGVVAHETGHIAGGHLARQSADIERIKKQTALGLLLGVATASFGNVDAGYAVILGSSHIAQRSFFSFAKKHEDSADEAALRYLDKAQLSSQGLYDFFSYIKENEKLYYDEINPYTRTHPLTKFRLSRINSHLKTSPYTKSSLDDKTIKEWRIIQAKLDAYLNSPKDILKKYKFLHKDSHLIANIIANYKLGKIKKSLSLFKKVKGKNNPYILELKAQILYENGNFLQAKRILLKLDKQFINEILITVQLAQLVLNSKDQKYYQTMIEKLNLTIHKTKQPYIISWNLLAELYSKTGNKFLSFLSLAEAKYYLGDYQKAIFYAKKAKKIGKGDKKKLYRINDIIKSSKKKI